MVGDLHMQKFRFMEVNSKQTDPLDHSLFYIYSMNHQWPMTSHRDQKILSSQKAKRTFPGGGGGWLCSRNIEETVAEPSNGSRTGSIRPW